MKAITRIFEHIKNFIYTHIFLLERKAFKKDMEIV